MRGRPLRFADFTGGWNPSAGPSGLAENEASALLNVRPTVRGSLRGRDGDSEILDSTAVFAGSEITSLNTVGALGAGELDGLLIGTADGKLWPYTTASPSSLGTFTVGKVWDFIDAPASGGQGPMYGVNGTDAKQITTAPAIADWTAATGTFPAGAKYLAYVGNRVLAAGMTSYAGAKDPTSLVAASNLGDPRDWAGWQVELDPNDGEAITAIGEVGAGVLVFKRSKAWLIYDLDTGANRPLGIGVGCISHRSIQQTPNGTIFLGERNVWITDGTTTRSLSDNIETTLKTALVAGSLPTATSAMDGQRYLLVYAETSRYALEYDMQLKSWWRHQLRGRVIASARLSGESDGIYVGGTGGLDRAFDSGHLNADGSVLSRYWSGPYHTFGPGRDRLRGVEIEGFGTFGIFVIPDFGSPIGSANGAFRSEKALGSTATSRRESDFTVFRGAQISFIATGLDPFNPIPGYVADQMQIDAYTLYVTRRAG